MGRASRKLGAPQSYRTKGSLEDVLGDLLKAGGIDDLVTGPKDTSLLSELFHARQTKIDELDGLEIVGWGRGIDPEYARFKKVSFAAICSDGSKLCFGIGNSVDALYAKKGDG